MRLLDLVTFWIATTSLIAFTSCNAAAAATLNISPSPRPFVLRSKQQRNRTIGGGLHIFSRHFQRRRSSTVQPSSKWKQLYCASGFHLQILPNGFVNGTKEVDSKFALLEMTSVSVSMVTIKGVASGKYLCLSRKGRVQARNLDDEMADEGYEDITAMPQIKRRRECVFEEQHTPHHWITYMAYESSQGRRKSYLGIGPNGKAKRGRNKRKEFTHFQIRTIHQLQPS